MEPRKKTFEVPRIVRRCHCRQQTEKAWGYDLCEWVGGRKSWKNHGKATHPEDVVKYAADKGLKTILIRCNGCGSDVLREYPANVQDHTRAGAQDAAETTDSLPKNEL